MSAVVLYHGFEVLGYRHEKTEIVEGRLVMRLSQSKESCRCSACRSREVVLSGVSEREFRSAPIGRQPVTIVLPIPRVACRACGVVRQVAVTFAEPRRTYTKSFARYALELSRLMTIKDVACHLGVSWDMIKEILKADLGKRFGKPKLKYLKRIAIDEISEGKGHR